MGKIIHKDHFSQKMTCFLTFRKIIGPSSTEVLKKQVLKVRKKLENVIKIEAEMKNFDLSNFP